MLVSLLSSCHRTGIRGSNRAKMFLAKRVKSLQQVALPTGHGDICVDLRLISAHRFLNPPPSEGEDVVMKRIIRGGDVVYDIGANFGIFSLLMSDLVGANGRVLAFEPNPEILKNLELTLSKKTNVKLFPVALSDQEGEATLFVPEDLTMASLGNWTAEAKFGGEIHQTTCQMITLDNLVKTENLPLPAFVKCDVEGAELSVLRGGRSVFDRADAPLFMFEVNKDAAKGLKNDQVISEFLDALPQPRYKYFEIMKNGDLRSTDSSNFDWTNVLAVPTSKLGILN